MAIKNITDLNNQANTLLPDNNQQQISPEDVRTAIKDLNDSAINRITDKNYLNLRAYNASRNYEVGEGVFYGNIIYEALQNTTGAFNPSDWAARSSPNGTWGSILGDINNQTDLIALLNAKQAAITPNVPLFFSGSVLNIQQANASQNGYLSQSDWTIFNGKENFITVSAPLVRTGDTLSVQYVSDTQDGVVSSADWMAINNSFIDITYTDALTLITGTGLGKGKSYKIAGGSRMNEGTGTSGSILLKALETDLFGSEGYLIARVPRYEEIGTSISGIWTALVLPSVNDLYIYNGKVYQNLTGVNDITPDSDMVNWQLIDPSEVNYKTEVDYIQYDFANDWIYYREDKRGNRYTYTQLNGSSVNGIDKFQWGNDGVFGNTVDNGILNNLNSVTSSSKNNLAKSGIYLSEATTTNRTYTFRDLDGTVAFLSDIDGFTEISHADLLLLIAGNNLIVGMYYKITDFQTVHVIPETTVVNTGTMEPLICMAVSDNKIDSRVYSTLFPEDLIQYDVTNILAEDSTTARKGKIIYRKDRIKNLETWYDFRAVKFRRWKVDGTGMTPWTSTTGYARGQIVYVSGGVYKALQNHTSSSSFGSDNSNNLWVQLFTTPTLNVFWKTSITEFGGTIPVNTSDFLDVLTFANGSKNISIATNSNQPYNNVVYLGAGNGDVFGLNCKDITCFNSAQFNSVGKNCYGILLFNAAEYNKIGDNCSGLILSDNASYNIIEDSAKQTSLSYGASYNVLGNSSENNFVLNSSSGNKLHRETKFNLLTGSVYDNVIGNKSEGNIINNSARANVIGTISNGSVGSNSNFITNSAYANFIGDGSNSNTFTNGSFGNKLGNQCSSNSFTNSSSFNMIGNGSGSNTFLNSSNNSIGLSSSNNTFGNNANGNSIGNKSDYNAFGNNSLGNRIGNYCTSNQILPSSAYYTSVSGQYNVFENYCSNNVINGNFNRLDSYCNFIQCSSQVYMSNCFFCSGTQNIAFSGQFIIDNLRVLLSRDYSTTMTITVTTALSYNNIVVDLKDSQGVLWYKTISLTGRIGTKKFI